MEQNLPLIITKKLWNIVRLAFFMLKKGFCKNKIIFNLNMLMKRGKIATKVALNNLIFHHYNNHHLHFSTTGTAVNQPSHHQNATTNSTKEYLFSGGATPLYLHHSTNKKTGYQYQQDYFYSSMSTPYNFEDTENLEVINKVMEIMVSNKVSGVLVRQVRITDSPFPLQDEENYDHHVDKAADNFIMKFHSRIKEQE